MLDARFADAHYQYERLRRTNVLNTAFPIWYDGHIGVINGLHLGRLPTNPVSPRPLTNQTSSTHAQPMRFVFSYFFLKISWPEINGALGQCAMLVTCLAKKLSYTFKK